MDFFDNQDDNSKTNEVLLDQVMAQHKKREDKHNIKKGYLLSRKVGPVSNPYAKDEGTIKNDNPSPPRQLSEPLFVVGNKKYSNKPNTRKESTEVVKKIIVVLAVLVIILTAILVTIFFMDVHTIDFVCGNMGGITIYDKNRTELDSLSLRLNQSASFKIELKQNYTDSEIQVLYNNVEIKPDKDGFYTVKYTGEGGEIRIMGVMENQYTVTTKGYGDLKIYTQDTNGAFSKDITDVGITKAVNEKIQFKVYDTKKSQYVKAPYASVYLDDKLLTATNDIFEATFTKNCKLNVYNFSPFEYFTFSPVYDPNNANSIIGYNLINVTQLGLQSPVLALPTVYNGLPVTYTLNGNDYYPEIKELIVNANMITNYEMFDMFSDLEKIVVIEHQDSGLYSQDGLLYNRVVTPSTVAGVDDVVKVQLIKCPSGYGKDLAEGARILAINPDEICEGTFYKINYLKTISMGDKVVRIEPLAFFKDGVGQKYSFVFNNNTHFKVENNVIYSASGDIIVAAQFAEGEFVVPNGAVLEDCALRYSSITKLVFEGEATIPLQSFTGMRQLTEIVMPKNLVYLGVLEFFDCKNLKILNLENVEIMPEINPNALLFLEKLEKIVVPYDMYDEYLTEYASAPFIDLIIQGENDDAIVV